VQNQVLGLGRALRDLGVDARILAPCDGPPPDPAVTPLGSSVPTASNGSTAAIAPDPAATLRTIRALRDERFEVVNVHEPLAPGPSLSTVVFCDAPLVGTFHRCGQSGWVRAFRRLGVWALANLDLRVAVSEAARDTAAEAVGGEYEVLWNGVDLERFERARPWPKAGQVVMFVGRHEPRKGLEVLLEAFARLEGDCGLWLASSGAGLELLRARFGSDKRIEWLGMISEQEKISRLRAADVLCAPSLGGESFGVVLLEGMAGGALVVASDIEGYRLVGGGGAALLVPPGDPARLEGALRRALSASSELEALRRAGTARARQYSMEALARRYLELYEQVARVGHARRRGDPWPKRG